MTSILQGQPLGAFSNSRFSSVSFKVTLVLLAGRSDPTDTQDVCYQVYLASHIRFCLFLVCTSGQQTKNTLTKECSLYSAVLFLTSIYRSTWTCQWTFIFTPSHVLTYNEEIPACCQTVSAPFPVPLTKRTWVTCQILCWQLSYAVLEQ